MYIHPTPLNHHYYSIGNTIIPFSQQQSPVPAAQNGVIFIPGYPEQQQQLNQQFPQQYSQSYQAVIPLNNLNNITRPILQQLIPFPNPQLIQRQQTYLQQQQQQQQLQSSAGFNQVAIAPQNNQGVSMRPEYHHLRRSSTSSSYQSNNSNLSAATSSKPQQQQQYLPQLDSAQPQQQQTAYQQQPYEPQYQQFYQNNTLTLTAPQFSPQTTQYIQVSPPIPLVNYGLLPNHALGSSSPLRQAITTPAVNIVSNISPMICQNLPRSSSPVIIQHQITTANPARNNVLRSSNNNNNNSFTTRPNPLQQSISSQINQENNKLQKQCPNSQGLQPANPSSSHQYGLKPYEKISLEQRQDLDEMFLQFEERRRIFNNKLKIYSDTNTNNFYSAEQQQQPVYQVKILKNQDELPNNHSVPVKTITTTVSHNFSNKDNNNSNSNTINNSSNIHNNNNAIYPSTLSAYPLSNSYVIPSVGSINMLKQQTKQPKGYEESLVIQDSQHRQTLGLTSLLKQNEDQGQVERNCQEGDDLYEYHSKQRHFQKAECLGLDPQEQEVEEQGEQENYYGQQNEEEGGEELESDPNYDNCDQEFEQSQSHQEQYQYQQQLHSERLTEQGEESEGDIIAITNPENRKNQYSSIQPRQQELHGERKLKVSDLDKEKHIPNNGGEYQAQYHQYHLHQRHQAHVPSDIVKHGIQGEGVELNGQQHQEGEQVVEEMQESEENQYQKQQQLIGKIIEQNGQYCEEELVRFRANELLRENALREMKLILAIEREEREELLRLSQGI